MIKYIFFLISIIILVSFVACDKSGGGKTDNGTGNTGIKIAYVNGDSILTNFEEFRKQSEAMGEKQRKAEELLQSKGVALEREFMNYQQQAQKGTMTGKEMEAREKYLSNKQESILAERDKIANEILDETSEINNRLEKVLHEKLNEIKQKEGYDFIFSYIKGGSILIADSAYDITERVLKELNKVPANELAPADSTGKK